MDVAPLGRAAVAVKVDEIGGHDMADFVRTGISGIRELTADGNGERDTL